MIEFATPLGLLVLPPLLYLWWRVGRGPRAVGPLRVGILLLCALIFASPVLLFGGMGRNIVFVIDRSLSAGDVAVPAGAEMLELSRREKQPSDHVSAVAFGEGASAVLREGGAGELSTSSYDDASDLYAGLRLAASLCGARQGGGIVLISDGLHTGRDPLGLLPELHKNSVRLDFWPVSKERRNDVAVTAVRLPERVRVGEPYELSFTVASPIRCKAGIGVHSEGEVRRREVTLEPGTNRFVLRDAAPRTGLNRRVVSVEVGEDSMPLNNRAVAVTEAVGPPAVLVVTADGRPDNLARALSAGGLNVRMAGPGADLSSASLKAFRAVVLDDVALSSLQDRADAALRNYVRRMGGGLLVSGGKRSFAAGGYYKSRLEEVLPVSMERKDEYRRPRLAMAVVLDRSGSMGVSVSAGLSKMDLANRAAAEAVALLRGSDEVAVFAVDSMAHGEVPLTRVGEDFEDLRATILSIESGGGGIFVYNGLQAGVQELLESEAPTRHIVLFADAADSEQPGDYKNLVSKWADAGGTVTVVGLGTEADRDAEFLKDVARIGGGEALFTRDAASLPRVFCEDVMRIARKTFVEEQTGAEVTPLIVRLGRLGISEFPSFGGYNLCFAKPEAETIVRTADEHAAPVLAVWQRGLGKAAALTCQADGPYTGELRGWADYKPFFASLAKWLRRERDDPSLFGTILREGRSGTVVLEMDSGAADSCTGATALLIPPDEKEPEKVPLQWVSLRRMEGRFRLVKDGIYHGLVLTNGGKRVALPPVVLPYSPEYRPREPAAGMRRMQRLAEATGGGRLMHVEDVFAGASADPRRAGRLNLSPFLAGLALLLLLCDIVTRKALWSHLLPERLRSGAAGVARGAAAAPRRLVTWGAALVPKLRKSPGGLPSAAPEEEQPEEPAEEAEEEESIYKEAKRRARK